MTDPNAEVEQQAAHDGLQHYPDAFLQNLIDNGEGWQSEGALSKAVVRALEDGTCVLGVIAQHDYHGRTVPARGDVAPGAKGSLAYANRLRAERGAPLLIETADGSVSTAGA
jgi:hypothetical protein